MGVGRQRDQGDDAPGRGDPGPGGQAQVHATDEGGAGQVSEFGAEENAAQVKPAESALTGGG